MSSQIGVSVESSTNLSRKDLSFLGRAIALAKTSECRQKHGAIIVKSSSVIGWGVNRYRNNPTTQCPVDAFSIHAELNALKSIKSFDRYKMPRTLYTGCSIYIARIDAYGEPTLSRPCDTCYSELLDYGITKIIHTI